MVSLSGSGGCLSTPRGWEGGKPWQMLTSQHCTAAGTASCAGQLPPPAWGQHGRCYQTAQLAQRWPPSTAKSGPWAPAAGRGKRRQDVLSCGRQVLSHEPLLTSLTTWRGSPTHHPDLCLLAGPPTPSLAWGRVCLLSACPASAAATMQTCTFLSQTSAFGVTGKPRSQRKPVSAEDRNSGMPAPAGHVSQASLRGRCRECEPLSVPLSPSHPSKWHLRGLWGTG